MMYVLYALKLKLRLRRNPFVVFFIAQISHTPGSQTQIARGRNEGLKNTGPHYGADATKAVPEPY